MSLLEDNLRNYFVTQVGRTHASQLQLGNYLPLMKQYPHIVEQEISRFNNYFSGQALPDNHGSAIVHLFNIAGQIPSVRPSIIQNLGPILYEYMPIWREGDTRAYNNLVSLLTILEVPISGKEMYYREIVRSVNALKKPLIVIIGAGFSYDTMPITNELQPLLVQFLLRAGITEPLNMMRDDIQQVWAIVKDKQDIFKDLFLGWCTKTAPSPQHNLLANMFHQGHISHLISFNWDNLIERVYSSIYTDNISKINKEGCFPEQPSLWKLHGDIDDLSSEWVFPYEQGRVFKSLVDSIKQVIEKDCPMYALIIGYNEYEPIVKGKLITYLEGYVSKVIRVRPNLEETIKGLPENAKSFMERLSIYLQMG